MAKASHEKRRLKELRSQGLKSLSKTTQEYEYADRHDDNGATVEHNLLEEDFKRNSSIDKVELSRVLADLALQHLIEQYHTSINYIYCAVSQCEFMVRCINWEIN
jgi:hypothetical protein